MTHPTLAAALVAERHALERISRMAFRAFWNDAVLYLGVDPVTAMAVWKRAAAIRERCP